MTKGLLKKNQPPYLYALKEVRHLRRLYQAPRSP